MPEWASADEDPEPTIGGTFLVIGICLACYAGHPCLPSFYTQAADKSSFLSSTAGGFGIAIGYYFLVGAVGAHAFGGRAAQNIIESVGHDLEGRALGPWAVLMQKICAAGLALKIQVVCVLIANPVMHALGAGEGFPARVAFAVASVLIALCFADQIAALMAVVGLAATMCTSVLFPLTLQLYTVAASRGLQLLLKSAIVGAAVLAVLGTSLVALSPK